MKIKLLLLAGIGFVPSILLAQTAPYLYNRGVMSVVSTANAAPTTTTLYIGGDFIAGHDPANPATTCLITLKDTRTKLTGNFFHGLNSGATTTASANSNVFTFLAADRSQFVFEGSAAQTIKLATGSIYQPLLKGQNYINFPEMVVNNINHVTQVPELASSARSLAFETGRLILDSRRVVAGEVSGTLHSANTSTMLSHFMVNSAGAITTKNTTLVNNGVANHNKFGAVQVNLALDPKVTNTNNSHLGRSLVGMGSPFKNMLSDYFFWNFLMIPRNESIIGEFDGTNMGGIVGTGNTMTDPQRTLPAGRGFVIGIDLRETFDGTNSTNYAYDLHPMYKVVTPAQKPDFSQRVVEKYEFSRFGNFYSNKNNVRRLASNGTYDASLHQNIRAGVNLTATTEPAYRDEVLNFGDITGLTIEQGYNYYSNPYTVPLDMSGIVNGANSTGPWKVNSADPGATGRDVSTSVWVLDPSARGSGTYNIMNPTPPVGESPGNKWLMVNAPYRVMRPVAATTTYDSGTGGSRFEIAPLQMFVLYSPSGATNRLTIPASARSIGGNAYFLRSASAVSEELKDDFLFSVTDGTTLGADRTAIAIRTPQDVMTNTRYSSIQKIITQITSDKTTTRTTLAEGEVAQGTSSVLYTMNDKGTALESNILGVPDSADSESIPLYLTPSRVNQKITINVARTDSKQRVKQIMLKDKTANKEVDLLANPTYSTNTKSTDPVDRFTLKFVFNRNTSGIEDDNNSSEGKSITSYYQSGTLTLAGFDDLDYGSAISVYDIQGRMVAQAKVDNTTVLINQAFSAGAYIVKVVGNKSYAAKFLVK